MLRTSVRRGVVGGTALALGLAGLTIGQVAAHAGAPLSVDQAGPVAVWGPAPASDPTAPPLSLTPAQKSEAFTKVVANGGGSAIGLTADGRLETLGTNIYAGPPFNYDQIPAELADKTVVDIAGALTGHGDGMAVTSTGDVYRWSTPYDAWDNASNLPAANELQGSKAAAISPNGSLAAVVKQDGSVLVWGDTTIPGDYDQKKHQDDLTGVTSVSFSGDARDVYALKSDGTLAAWGANDGASTGANGAGQTDLPTVTTDTTDDVDVTDVASAGNSAVALLSNGQLTAWGGNTAPGKENAVPDDVEGKQIVALAASPTIYFAVDSDGGVYEWGQGAGTDWKANQGVAFAQLPDGVDPANITGLSANAYFATAIQATYGYISKPKVSGTAKAGQTLTATPATFTATPDEDPTRQWLADDKPIAGATGTTYKLTTAEIGKQITYSETANRGTETAIAISDPTAKVTAASTGGGTTVQQPGDDHAAALTPAQQKLAKDKAKVHQVKKKFKKKIKKAHGSKKAKLKHKMKNKVKKLKKKIKKDKKLVKQGK